MENLKTYKEKLDFLNNNNLEASEFLIAQEMKYQLECFEDEDGNPKPLSATEEQFEEMCEATKYEYLKNDYATICDICMAIARLFNRTNKTDFSRHEIEDEIEY